VLTEIYINEVTLYVFILFLYELSKRNVNKSRHYIAANYRNIIE